MGKRNYTAGDRAGLISLSQGSCYWPGCSTPVLVFVKGRPKINLQIAHIFASSDGGPRAIPDLEEKERDSFTNLILLCKPHHDTVDKDEPENYPPETLLEWKRERETSGQAALAGLSNVTEERLQEIITDAIKQRDQQVKNALDRFAEIDSESAAALRELLDELDEFRRHGPILNEDTVSMLHSAASQLGHLPDSANTLSEAASKIANLEDSANSLDDAADKAAGLNDIATALNSAADKASDLSYIASDLRDAAARMEDFR
ncbi:HNH endonuclease [Saccharopolyspora spinosa]|uniref:HNH endonuclease n=1 Tax=Saccharopolyspora spinosa TaxID=60894 RepID=A0A2N3Y408_SACSN|nr:HNH endonuclease [Saccharopolyspora spinosa]PKW17634.1 hypothetical protein A8926_5622 [Saccharopolyspora spinosa]